MSFPVGAGVSVVGTWLCGERARRPTHTIIRGSRGRGKCGFREVSMQRAVMEFGPTVQECSHPACPAVFCGVWRARHSGLLAVTDESTGGRSGGGRGAWVGTWAGKGHEPQVSKGPPDTMVSLPPQVWKAF